jgi:hypothetical protein
MVDTMTTRRISGLMMFEAATLIVASTFHLSGADQVGGTPFSPNRAGVAEAIIAVVLLAGVVAFRRGARRLAIASVAFAIAGFLIGLSMAVRGGAALDIAYHAVMLPILLLTLAQLAHAQARAAQTRAR